MNKEKKPLVPPGTYFWTIAGLVLLALLVGAIMALFYKGDTLDMLGGRGAMTNQTNKLTNQPSK